MSFFDNRGELGSEIHIFFLII